MVELVVLLPTRVFGGHERMLVRWLESAVARHGLRVRLHAAPNAELVRECEAAGLARPAPSYPARAGAWRDFWLTWRLLGRVPRESPVLLAPGVLQQSMLQWLAAFLRRRRVAGYVPMAWSSRRMRFRGGPLRDWVVGHFVRRVDLWITISPEQRELLRRHWHVARPVLVVPNRPAAAESELAAAPSATRRVPLRVLFAGRFDANQKGLDWLCDALRARRSEWDGGLRFTFKGQGPFAPRLLELQAELGAGRVAVSPWGEVAEAMAGADVLLMPSRYEGVPLVALEATHYGVPVVATREAGVSDFVPRQCLFDFGDAAGMWAALEAMRDPAAREAALAWSRGRVRLLFSAASFREQVDRVVDAFGRLAGGPLAAVP